MTPLPHAPGPWKLVYINDSQAYLRNVVTGESWPEGRFASYERAESRCWVLNEPYAVVAEDMRDKGDWPDE